MGVALEKGAGKRRNLWTIVCLYVEYQDAHKKIYILNSNRQSAFRSWKQSAIMIMLTLLLNSYKWSMNWGNATYIYIYRYPFRPVTMRQLTSSLLARSPAAETWKNCRTLIHLEDGPPDVSPNSLCFGFPFELWWLWGSLGYLPRGPVGKIIECWYFHSLLEDAGGCFHSIFLKKGLPGCLQFYHDNCSKPGEKLNQEIIDRLQTENTHLKS